MPNAQCRQQMKNAGEKAIPRSCPTCKFSPCQRGLADHHTKPDRFPDLPDTLHGAQLLIAELLAQNEHLKARVNAADALAYWAREFTINADAFARLNTEITAYRATGGQNDG